MAKRVNVQSVRTAMGLSIGAFAKKLGVHERTVSRWENARTDPSPLAMTRLQDLHSEHAAETAPRRRTLTAMSMDAHEDDSNETDSL